MAENEKYEEDFEAMSKALNKAFDTFFFDAYIKFRLNPETIEVSEISRRAFERARNGALRKLKETFKGRTEKEYEEMLESCYQKELLRVFEKETDIQSHTD